MAGAPADAAAHDVSADGAPAADVTRLRALVDRIQPVTLAHERALPVLAPLEPLLPGAGLQRGSTVQVAGGPGATKLAFALLAGPTRAGSWAACVGLPELGWAGAAEVGVALERVVVVRPPERAWATVVAALVDAFDVVVCGPAHAPGAAEVRRLTARARERGAVLVAVGGAGAAGGAPGRGRRAWPGPDVRMSVTEARWSGPGQGWGHLRARRATVTVDGRRGLDRPRRADLWLPGPDGISAVEDRPVDGGLVGGGPVGGDPVGPGADVVPLRRRTG
jgi:hypothetical protein